MLSNMYHPIDILISETFKLVISKHFISGLLIRRIPFFMFVIDISFDVISRDTSIGIIQAFEWPVRGNKL